MNKKILCLVLILGIVLVSGCTSDPENTTYKSEYMEFEYPDNYNAEVLSSGMAVQLNKTGRSALKVGVYSEEEYTEWKEMCEQEDWLYLKKSLVISNINCTKYTTSNYEEETYFFEKNNKNFIITYFRPNDDEIVPHIISTLK